MTADWRLSILLGLLTGIMGGFGHNWVHQPKYRNWAYMGLDAMGMSSEGWIREHLLQHHMYTNTPLDNHYEGTAPFFIVDPTKERNFFQSKIMVWLNPVFLFFGIPANYWAHLVQLLCREENFSIGKLFFPTKLLLLYRQWGWYGCILQLVATGMCSVQYFTVALMNHNTKGSWNLEGKNGTSDWGIAQVYSCADIEPGLSFLQSIKYLWLNYHTVHHLFPHTDMSKHPGIQKILIETCKEFDVKYETNDFFTMYKEMMHTFSYPRYLGKEVKPYFN